MGSAFAADLKEQFRNTSHRNQAASEADAGPFRGNRTMTDYRAGTR
jgi:hypothetical protein